ncbi:unnamed protein product [Lymnaea stagnalis]|uniref:Protein CUSTOS n=1 Tax=Lymnaea stagnalis TaxID=6523 RepID=A0AAV2HNE1_LYMST
MNSKSKENGSSSSDSSDDEEEARKIQEALCDESIFSPKSVSPQTTVVGRIPVPFFKSSGSVAKEELTHEFKAQMKSLKSNRPQDKHDDNEGNLLDTTPEFRAHVAKLLSQMLDKKLSKKLSEQIWSLPKWLNKSTDSGTGIKLFSDSKTWCTIQDKQSFFDQVPGVARKKRKLRMSTSSESSEDEKIGACVFSLNDIQKENDILSKLEAQVPSARSECGQETKMGQHKNDITSFKSPESIASTDDKIIIKKKKKKKKTKINENAT